MTSTGKIFTFCLSTTIMSYGSYKGECQYHNNSHEKMILKNAWNTKFNEL